MWHAKYAKNAKEMTNITKHKLESTYWYEYRKSVRLLKKEGVSALLIGKIGSLMIKAFSRGYETGFEDALIQ
jgi:predicted Fe-Mo cluster-binding NifX family protein